MKWGVIVVLRRDDGAVLIQRRDMVPGIAHPGRWSLITGGVEEDDSRRAGVRELEEETGYIAFDEDLTLVARKRDIVDADMVVRDLYLVRYDPVQQIECMEGDSMMFAHPTQFKSLNVIGDHIARVNETEGLLHAGMREREPLFLAR